MTNPTPEQIAASLSKAQREAISSMPDKNLDRWNRHVRYPTGQVLRRLGLLAYIPLRPTELGLAVRSLLTKDTQP